MANIFSVNSEFATILAEVFTVRLREAIESGMTLKFCCASAPAVGIYGLIDLPGEGIIWTHYL